jgi:hypothetical protein
MKLVTYPGGHGWAPHTHYCDRVKEGIQWLKQMNSRQDAGAGADKAGRRNLGT